MNEDIKNILELLAKKIEEQTSIIASCSSIINKKAEARERTEYIKIKEFVETLIAENKELKEEIHEIKEIIKYASDCDSPTLGEILKVLEE